MAYRTVSIDETDYAEYQKILESLKLKPGFQKLKLPGAILMAMTMLKESLESEEEEKND